MSSSMTATTSTELDERVLAKASLDAAEELLQSLCASHAGTFVSVERRAATKSVQVKLQKAQEALEHEEQGGGAGTTSGDGEGGGDSGAGDYKNNNQGHATIAILSEKHRVRRRTLLQHSSLLELLELPSLMDACVRSNLYEEALSIAAFANTLERRHYNNNNNNTTTTITNAAAAGQPQQNSQQVIVVARVIEQIRSRQVDLRRHLLHRLKTTVTMPECLEVVTALRRLNSIALECRQQQLQMSNTRNNNADLERVHAAMELRLQVDFLEARDFWLETSSSSTTVMNQSSSSTSMAKGTTSATSTATSSSSEEDLLDTIERYRTRVFEVATRE
jgi:conserved oligomeric Golgi complex subunit 8